MKFLSNENFPIASVSYLRKAGYNVASISELSPGISDTEVLKIAQNESRILLTFDGDYGELIFVKQLMPPPALIYLRLTPAAPKEAGEIVQEFIKQQSHRIIGNFCVISRSLIRIRPLPT